MEEKNHFDLCVIGAGPAGIILVLEFAKNNPHKKIALIEFGKRNEASNNNLDDSIDIIHKENHHLPYECTNKGFGGTSKTWGGRCVSFDPIDFLDRSIIQNGCTWDLALFDDLKPYSAKASEYFECGSDVFNSKQIPLYSNERIAENFVEGIVSDSNLERWSMPTRFGTRYLSEIENYKNIQLFEACEADEFIESEKSGHINSLKLLKKELNQIEIISSEVFVIAAGAQESTRLLLKNPSVFSSLEKIPDALGKYYQGHLSGKIASVKFYGDPKKTDYGFMRDADGSYMRRRFQFDTQFLKENNLLNAAIWLDNPLYHDASHRSGAMSFMYLAMITPFLGKRLAPPAIKNAFTKGKVEGIGQHILNILKDLPGSLLIPAKIFYKRYCLKRKLPGVFLYSPKNTYALHFHSEQVPDPLNAMKLSSDGKRLEIDYHLSESDIQSVIRLHEILDQYLQSINCGKLEYWFPKEQLADAIKSMSKDGIHQSGTTRIADNPELGVVDRNLKVFGTENLYVCSSSVFPTSGQANPTYFLGMFAVRLAKYLNDNLNNKSN